MATLTFSFETGAVPLAKIVDAFASAYNYQATVGDPPAPNPESKASFARRMVRRYIVEIVKSQDVEAAVKPARDGVTEIPLT